MQNNTCPTSHCVLSRRNRNKENQAPEYQLFIKKVSTHGPLKLSFLPENAVCDSMGHPLAKHKSCSGC